MVNKKKDLKFFSTGILGSFLRPFPRYKNMYMFYLQYLLKNGFKGEH